MIKDSKTKKLVLNFLSNSQESQVRSVNVKQLLEISNTVIERHDVLLIKQIKDYD